MRIRGKKKKKESKKGEKKNSKGVDGDLGDFVGWIDKIHTHKHRRQLSLSEEKQAERFMRGKKKRNGNRDPSNTKH